MTTTDPDLFALQPEPLVPGQGQLCQGCAERREPVGTSKTDVCIFCEMTHCNPDYRVIDGREECDWFTAKREEKRDERLTVR